MRQLLLGKNRRKRRFSSYKDNHYEKEPKVIKPCGNPTCKNTFIGTKNGRQEFCNRKCLRKVRGEAIEKK